MHNSHNIYCILLAWYICFKLWASFSECQCVRFYYIIKKMTLYVYLLVIKSHSGLLFYTMSVKPMKLCERGRFTTGVNSLRFAGFSCRVTFYRHWGSGQGKEGSLFFKSYLWSGCILTQIVLRWFVKHFVMKNIIMSIFCSGKKSV